MVNILTSPDFLLMRADPEKRSAFLAALALKNRGCIRAVVKEARNAIFDNDDATQLFLIAANAAVDTALIADDGRGANDPEAWCRTKAMWAVRDGLRAAMGRVRRDRRFRVRLLEVPYKHDESSLHYADPNDYADEACANLNISELLSGLSSFDREAAMLLIYGAGDYSEMVCRCGDATHSYIQDLALALGCSEFRIFKMLRRLRNAFGERAA